MTTGQVYAIIVLAIGAAVALSASRHAVRGDLLSGTLGGGAAVGMIVLAVVVRAGI